MSEQIALDEVAAGHRINMSPKTLRNKRVRGDGPPFVKMGRSVRYRVQDLDDWIAARVVTSTSKRVAA